MRKPSRLEELKDWRKHLPKVLEVIRRRFPDCETYLIGSAVEGKFHAGSDVDLLIVCREKRSLLEVARALAELEDAGVPRIFQLHLATPEAAERYRALGKVVRV